MNLKCAQCVQEFAQLPSTERSEALATEGAFDAMVLEPITLVPSWAQMNMNGQLVMGCVPLPTCLKHIEKAQDMPQNIASRAGLVTG